MNAFIWTTCRRLPCMRGATCTETSSVKSFALSKPPFVLTSLSCCLFHVVVVMMGYVSGFCLLRQSCALYRTDFIITGSQDGHVKFWKKREDEGVEFVKHFRSHLGKKIVTHAQFPCIQCWKNVILNMCLIYLCRIHGMHCCQFRGGYFLFCWR